MQYFAHHSQLQQIILQRGKQKQLKSHIFLNPKSMHLITGEFKA